MRCLGWTTTLKRCGLEGSPFLCHHHRRKTLAIVLFILVPTVIVYWNELLRPGYLWLTTGPPQPPGFRVTSTAIDVPDPNEGEVPLSEVGSRMRNFLTIENPNRFPLTAMKLSIQWPEPIISVRSAEASAHYTVVASENWDSQPLTVSGDISSLVVESFASDEKTGLWNISVSAIPANNTIEIELVTAVGPEGGLYAEESYALESTIAMNELLWFIEGSYQYSLDAETETGSVLLSLVFDRQTRVFQVRPVGSEQGSTVRIGIRQGRGARVPGVFRTRGYIVVLANERDVVSYVSPVMLERQDLNVKLGLFGSPPTKPGFVVEIRKPTS